MTREIKESEQSKEAEIVRLLTPSRTICIDWMTDKSALPSQSSMAATSFHSPRRTAACARKANSHVVVKDADVHSLDELRATRRVAVVRGI
jgi:hypothetical protein